MALTIAQGRLKELLHYNPETGVFTRLVDTGPNAKAGDVVGSKNNNGYLRVVLDGKLYALHRLAVVYMTGKMPEGDVDHANGDKADNRWSNLRPCSRAQNMANSKRQVNNKSGFKGVCYDARGQKKWRAQISVANKKVYLGSFDTAQDAHLAYIAAANKFHGEYAKV